MNLAIRLTRSASMLEEFFAKLPNVCDSSVWYEHPTDHKVNRTHCHGLIMDCKVSVETLKNWLRLIDNNWKRDNWSFKESYKMHGAVKPVDLKFMIYMSKGKYDPVFNHNVSDADQYKNAWIEVCKVQQDIRDFADPRRTEEQKTRWEMLQEVKRRLSLHSVELTTRMIIETIIDVFHHNRVIVSRFKIRDFYDSYMAYEVKGTFISEMETLCRRL